MEKTKIKEGEVKSLSKPPRNEAKPDVVPKPQRPKK